MEKRKLGRVLAMAVVAAFLIGSFSACLSAPKKYKIALLNYAENFESSQLIIKGVMKAAKKYNVEIVTADINSDPQKVPQSIDNFLLQKVDAIIDASWFADVGATTVAKCKERNIPLITCDVPFDTKYSYLVGADNYQAGVVAGNYMAKIIKQKWGGKLDYFVCFFPESAGPEVKKRQQGAIDTLRKLGFELPEGKVVWFDNGGQTLNAKAMAQDFLTAHPVSKKIIFAANNDAGGVGVLSAVEAANRSADCILYTYGAENTSVENFKTKKNCWIGSVNFSLDGYGAVAVPTAIKLIEGAKDVPRTQGPKLYMVDRSNVNKLGK